VPGIDLSDYKKTLIERFANPKIQDQLPRLCLNGSAKLPKFILGSLRDQLHQGGKIDYLSLAVAAWCRYLNGRDDWGKAIVIDDPIADLLKQQISGPDPNSLLNLSEIFGEDLPQSPRFVETVTEALGKLYQLGSRATLIELAKNLSTE
jgi:mannitol 2-dehydrogenase